MRHALLLLLLAGCGATLPHGQVCISTDALAAYQSTTAALAADDWLPRLQTLSHADQDGTDAAVSTALQVDREKAAGGDTDAAKRVQREREWLKHHPPKG